MVEMISPLTDEEMTKAFEEMDWDILLQESLEFVENLNKQETLPEDVDNNSEKLQQVRTT